MLPFARLLPRLHLQVIGGKFQIPRIKMLETHTNVSESAQLRITLELSYWFVSDPFPLVDGTVPPDV